MRYNILCIDSHRIVGLEASKALKNKRISIRDAVDLDEAKILSEQNKFHLIILKINSFDTNNLKTIRLIKEQEEFSHIPLMVISNFSNKQYVMEAIENGAEEYITSPYNDRVLMERVCRMLNLPIDKDVMANMEYDLITFSFEEFVTRQIKAAGRGNYPVSFLLLQVDLRKEDNDKDLLRLLRSVIRARIRDTDMVFSYDINTILLILPFSNAEGTQNVINKIHELLKSHSLLKKYALDLKLSSSFVTYPDDGRQEKALFELLEKRLREKF